MIMDIYYGNGDQVQYVKRVGEITKVNCGFCDGKGVIVGHDNSILECPLCQGKGYLEKDERAFSTTTGTIHDIKVYWDRQHRMPEITYLIDDNWVDQDDVNALVGE